MSRAGASTVGRPTIRFEVRALGGLAQKVQGGRANHFKILACLIALGLVHRAVEFNERLSRFDGLTILNVDRAHHASFERLNSFRLSGIDYPPRR